jgi:ribosomal protein S20
MRSAIRRVEEAGDEEERREAFRTAQALIDRAGRDHIIHPNKARRLKSRLSRSL